MNSKEAYINNISKINNLNKPSLTNSERKKEIKNVDNNISYSDSDEERKESYINNIIKNDNSYEDENFPNKENYNLKKSNVKNNSLNNNMSIRPNNYNNNLNKANSNSKNNVKKKNLNNNINIINFNRGASEQLNMQPRPTYNPLYSDQKISGYSNFFLNDKRAFSGEKNYRPNYKLYSPNPRMMNFSNRFGYSNQKYQNINNNSNNILQANYVPTNSNTKVTKIKKAPLDEINKMNPNTDIRKNLNYNFYNIGINNYHPINNLNMNSNLNQTSPNLNLGNYITKVKKLPSTNIEGIEDKTINNYNFNNNLNKMNSGDSIGGLPIQNENQLKKEFELPGGNKTIGYLPLRKPFSTNDLDIQSYNRLDSDNQPRFSNENPLLSNHYSNDILIQNINDNNNRNVQRGFISRNEDNKYHDLSLTMNYLNRPVLNNNKNFQSLNRPSVNNGRITVKKLPPLNNSNVSVTKNDILDSPYQNNKQNEPVINNQLNKPIMSIKEPRNKFSNNINVKKLVNNEIPNQNEQNIPDERESNPNIVNNNLFNNQINIINPNQRIIPPPNQQSQINSSPMIDSRSMNINYNNQQLNPLLKNNEQIEFKNNSNYVIRHQNNILIQSSNKQIIRENNNINENPNNLNQNNLIQQNINQNQIMTQNRNILNNIEPVRDTNVNKIENEEQIVLKEEEQEEQEEQNENIPSENQNNIQKKNNVDISYTDFDASGWVKNYGGVSRPGKDVNGNQKINQDSFVSLTNINNIKDFNIFGVLDGHGPDGHYVSLFASDYIPSQIINNPEIKALDNPEKIYEKLKDNNCQIISKAFHSCDEQLKRADFDAYDSGSTCILVIHIGEHIICANVGDSRAIVAYDDNNDPELNTLESAQLSTDYKPELPEETKRILMSGGEIGQMKDQYGQGIGPYRVWAKGKDYPGLAMSRSIGDLKGKNIGITSDPGITEYDLCESSKYIAICSDGVWEFLSNEIVQKIGKIYYLQGNASEFCHQIINNSVYMWKQNEINIDDITVVAIFF